MATHTANPAIDVHGMIEIGEIWHLMDFPLSQLRFTAANFGSLAITWVWQFMQVWVVGTFECDETST